MSRSHKLHSAEIVRRLQRIERLLLQPGGATIAELAEAGEVSIQMARRYIGTLEQLGLNVSNDQTINGTHGVRWLAKKSTAVFTASKRQK